MVSCGSNSVLEKSKVCCWFDSSEVSSSVPFLVVRSVREEGNCSFSSFLVFRAFLFEPKF